MCNIHFFRILKKTLLASSFILAISSLLSRILGVYRDHLFAKYFGASSMLDAYFAAFRIPDFLYTLLIVSSISSVFLPLFQKYKENNQLDEAYAFTSRILNSLLGFFLIISIGIMIFTEPLVSLYVPHFQEEQKDLTVQMIRLMMLSPFFFMLSSLMISVQQAFHKFLAQALAPILYNFGILFGLIVLSENHGIYGVAIGVVIGAVLQMLIQIPFFYQTGFHWSPVFLKIKEIKKLFPIILPRVLAISTVQITLMVDTILATSLGTGSITILTLATNIQSLPFGIVSLSIAITAFAYFTKSAAQNDMKMLKKQLQQHTEKTIFWLIPSIIGLAFIAEPLIAFLFEHGSFTSHDSIALIRILFILLIAVIFQGFIPLFIRVFFSLQKTWITFYISFFSLIINIVFSIYLSSLYGLEGIAWGTVISMATHVLLLTFFLHKTFGCFIRYHVLRNILFATLLMAASIYYFIYPFTQLLHPFWMIIIISINGGFVYLFSIKVMKYIVQEP
jgi:putative peptidoglycan lipid II flippase